MIATFFSPRYRAHPNLHSFPTRRSSDLFQELATLGPLGTLGYEAHALSVHDAERFAQAGKAWRKPLRVVQDRKSTRLNSSHPSNSYAVFCLKKKKNNNQHRIHWCHTNQQ